MEDLLNPGSCPKMEVYGMNFQHMPELSWRWAYPAVWAVVIVMSVGMLLWFRTRRWL